LAEISQALNAEELTSLADNTVKLVAYTIVSVKRDREQVMEGGEASVIVTDNMTGDAFRAWVLAKYLQEETEVPSKEYPLQMEMQPRGLQLTKEDLKYLRVYYVVSNRWPREPAKFEERETEVLRQIGERMQ
jgi:hypothetical protein